MQVSKVSDFSKKITSIICFGFSFLHPLVQKIKNVENAHSNFTISLETLVHIMKKHRVIM